MDGMNIHAIRGRACLSVVSLARGIIECKQQLIPVQSVVILALVAVEIVHNDRFKWKNPLLSRKESYRN